MQDLYPDILPYATHRLESGATHDLYIEECGSPDGIPVVFLHGGPGAGCEPTHRRFFDPEVYRIVLFDQRGCGRSTPHGELEENTSAYLVADLEGIREKLGVSRWLLFGGSWGSTLALLYAQTHRQRVLGLVLRGVFLGRSQDVGWFYGDGARRLFPEAWRDFLEPIPERERDDLLAAYHRRLTGSDELERLRCARAWAAWEARTACLRPNNEMVERFTAAHTALALARIECHYFVNRLFMEPEQLLRDVDRLRDLPGIIVHGRYDIICPMDQAVDLQRAWPASRLQIIPDAGHSASEPGIRRALVKATREFAGQLG